MLPNPRSKTKTIVVDGDIAGNVGSWDADGERVVGYSIGRTFWGRGIATAALASFVADYETSRPLVAYVAVQNVGSLRVAEKCGFRRVAEPGTASDGVVEVRIVLASNASLVCGL